MFTKIVIIDRSHLAVNMYRLLLKDKPATFLTANSYEEARPWFFKRGRIDLIIINSNIFGSRFDELYDRIWEDEPLAKVPKIFICKEGEKERQKQLKKLPASSILARPFHPDEFLGLVG